MTAMTGLDFSRQIRAGAFAWPGGYPLFLVTSDSAAICFKCAREEAARIRLAAMTKNNDGGWRPEAFDVNWESPDLYCDHCGDRIESAYAECE